MTLEELLARIAELGKLPASNPLGILCIQCGVYCIQDVNDKYKRWKCPNGHN